MSDVSTEDLVVSKTDIVLDFALPTVWSSSRLHADLSTHNSLPCFPTPVCSQTSSCRSTRSSSHCFLLFHLSQLPGDGIQTTYNQFSIIIDTNLPYVQTESLHCRGLGWSQSPCPWESSARSPCKCQSTVLYLFLERFPALFPATSPHCTHPQTRTNVPLSFQKPIIFLSHLSSSLTQSRFITGTS